MKSFNYKKYETQRLPIDIVNSLTTINKYRGRQEMFYKQKPDVLEKMIEIAKIQSTDASNRIEGIWTSDKRLKELVEKRTQPRNRKEQEIVGYRDVLNTIHTAHEGIDISPNIILQLHRDLYKQIGMDYGGKWKNVDNYIQEQKDDGSTFVRFQPLSAFETPTAMKELCEQFNIVNKMQRSDPLFLSFEFILDFLCIHPFNDGNGRMSRLLTLLLLYKTEFYVGKYISIEKIIEESKETYYESLQDSSTGWINEKNDSFHFVRYMLGIIISAYKAFEDRVVNVSLSQKSKFEQIKEVFNLQLGKLTKSKIQELCPSVSKTTIELYLSKLVKVKYITKIGDKKNTSYIKNNH